MNKQSNEPLEEALMARIKSFGRNITDTADRDVSEDDKARKSHRRCEVITHCVEEISNLLERIRTLKTQTL